MLCKGKEIFLSGKEKSHLFIIIAAFFFFYGKNKSKTKNILYICSRNQNIGNKKSNKSSSS
ncbi:hypothetical protein CFT61_02000 [Segatella copri]|uniref:Uncharacterized protein n=1 Tax=Segatella copri TaxID=165179 RepID=A0AA91TMY6_9BACT|nr:hypothetical protein CFT61_02000 [Segatella copri]